MSQMKLLHISSGQLWINRAAITTESCENETDSELPSTKAG